MAACILYLRPFLEALTPGFINGDDLRRRGAIRPYTFESSNLVTSLALKDRRGSSDVDRSQVSNERAEEAIPDRDEHCDVLPPIAHASPFQEIGGMTLGTQSGAYTKRASEEGYFSTMP